LTKQQAYEADEGRKMALTTEPVPIDKYKIKP